MENSSIEWTGNTWNPWIGCHKVSNGCGKCYMFREQTYYGRNPNVVVRSKTRFNAPLKFKEPSLIFTCSWSDWFIEEADEWREEAWEIIFNTPQHEYQLLTKRPERILNNLPDGGLPDNVWLGVSVEDIKFGLPRIDILRKIPAKVRFLSIEPLLEDLGKIDLTGIDWVIVGGESAPGRNKARIMHPDWARSVRDQCLAYGVPFFFKQWGQYDAAGKWYMSKHFEGYNLLDGKIWQQFPEINNIKHPKVG